MNKDNEVQELLYTKIEKIYEKEQRNHMLDLVLLVPKHTFELLNAVECAQVRYKDLIIMWSDGIRKMQIITKKEFNEKYNMNKNVKLTIDSVS